MKSGIYQILNIKTNKMYIGSAKNLNKRKQQHFYLLKKNKNENILLQNAFNKYGIENFIFSIIENCDLSILVEREQYYIDSTNSINKEIGYNLLSTANSTLGFRFSEESRKKMSDAKKGLKLRLGKKHSEETKLKISLANKGKSHIQTNETKRKISLANKGKKRTQEVKKKYSLARMNKSLTIETKEKISKKLSGSKNPNSKINEEIVKEIRIDFIKGMTYNQLVDKYYLKYSQIYKIIKKQIWRTVD
jgi:group I intron endonuclease